MVHSENKGITAILLLSGIAKREEIAHAPSQPDYVLADIDELRGMLWVKKPKWIYMI